MAEAIRAQERTLSPRRPLEVTADRRELELYHAAKAQLDPADREIITAAIELGQTHVQIAHTLALATPDAARFMLRRALIRLAERMDDAA